MISPELKAAREYEAREGALISEGDRPVYHFTPRIGWLNDPNGFSFYNGQYHLFYQYHPYNSFWGPMHWGHAVSKDLIRWEYLPAALAPDTDYDGAGCFSGSAVTMPDGRQLLMYTGCARYGLDESGRWRQTQNIAVSDGDVFVKYEGNPVIQDDKLPEDGDIYEFRDPYVWLCEDGSYRSLVGIASKTEGESAKLVLYRSEDGFHWEMDKVLFEDFLRIGIMWECPNLFKAGDSWVLIASPMDMEAEEANGSVRFPKGNNVCYILGQFDESMDEFVPNREPDKSYASYYPVDCGLDFYAPQIKNMPDGRCILIGWMQDPEMANLHDESIRIFGQMTVPRELSVRDGRLYQVPIREIENYRRGEVVLKNMEITSEEMTMPGIKGRVMDLEMELSSEDCSEFLIRFACSDKYYTELKWRPEQSVVSIDRSNSGQEDFISKRRAIRVADHDGKLKLRIMLDRWSAEIFINDGEQVISTTFYTEQEADAVTFCAEGKVMMNLTGYRIEF